MEALAERLKSLGVKFVVEPNIRFQGQVGEQATMFEAVTERDGRHVKQVPQRAIGNVLRLQQDILFLVHG